MPLKVWQGNAITRPCSVACLPGWGQQLQACPVRRGSVKHVADKPVVLRPEQGVPGLV